MRIMVKLIIKQNNSMTMDKLIKKCPLYNFYIKCNDSMDMTYIVTCSCTRNLPFYNTQNYAGISASHLI